MASSSIIQSAPLSSSRSRKYDVFLSFRGEDTRKTFVDHLYSSLKQSLLSIYKDDETLLRGESIRPSLFKAIEESRIAIIIFSKHYADSSWCLDELAHIMKCKEERALTVMPIFYDVDPSDVRKQKGDFEIAFAQHEAQSNNKAQAWRKALIDASNLAGWEPKHVANGHEAKFIKIIVDTILNSIGHLNPNVDEALVGMTTRLHDLKSQLDIGSDGVRMVGIWGIGGSGKTTLANSVCMEICSHFHGYCIVENIRDESRKNGLKKLQETMLSGVIQGVVTLGSVVEGKKKIKTMLCNKNVLIVLDDVSDCEQLEALAGSHNWFGSGSRIIITTRDVHLLRTHKVDEVCHARLLSDDEAMQLFSRHAFNKKEPVEDYKPLSLKVVSYAAGLPLALTVLGLFLNDKEKDLWIDTLGKLKDIPKEEIVQKLQISYDGLAPLEKELFLDIACFFRRVSKNEAMEILEACYSYPKSGIEVLREKALIFFDMDGRFDMHDLVQEMGHYIVREKQSRLWKREEIEGMCLTMENDKIEAVEYNGVIEYDYYTGNYKYGDSSNIFKSVSYMKKLRYLSVNMRPDHDEDLCFLSNELRYIDWEGCRVRSPFADSFRPVNLVVLKLSQSKQKELWKGCKVLC